MNYVRVLLVLFMSFLILFMCFGVLFRWLGALLDVLVIFKGKRVLAPAPFLKTLSNFLEKLVRGPGDHIQCSETSCYTFTGKNNILISSHKYGKQQNVLWKLISFQIRTSKQVWAYFRINMMITYKSIFWRIRKYKLFHIFSKYV